MGRCVVRFFVVSLLILWKLAVRASAANPPQPSECISKNNLVCGVPTIRDSPRTKDPLEAFRGEFPWHVAIYQKPTAASMYSCGGTLISDRFVLTAAYCAVDDQTYAPLSAEKFVLLLGYHNLDDANDVACTERVGVQKNHIHPDYQKQNHLHNPALLEMNQTISFSHRVLPVCFDTQGENTVSFYGTIGKVSGWDLTKTCNWLKATNVSIVNETHCMGSSTNAFDKTCCGRYVNGNILNAEQTGGGLVTMQNGRWELIGILSDPGHRTTEQYSTYIKVRYYREWIRSIQQPKTTGATARSTDRDCGKRKITKKYKIVNGVRSQDGEWPWYVSVFTHLGRDQKFVCGGTLLSASYVLTAASCVRDWDPHHSPFMVRLGQTQLLGGGIKSRDAIVVEIDRNENSHMALLRLEEEVQFDDYVQPICLPPTDRTFDSKTISRMGDIAGYGQTEPKGNFSQYLNSVRMPIVDSLLCMANGSREDSQSFLAKGKLCAGYGDGTGACLGDQGGGFYERDESDTWCITGIIDQIKINEDKNECDTTGYLTMTDVVEHLSWIVKKIDEWEPPHTHSSTAISISIPTVLAIGIVLFFLIRARKRPQIAEK